MLPNTPLIYGLQFEVSMPYPILLVFVCKGSHFKRTYKLYFGFLWYFILVSCGILFWFFAIK